MEHVTDITRIIQLAVAPVFLLTAIGTILLTGEPVPSEVVRSAASTRESAQS